MIVNITLVALFVMVIAEFWTMHLWTEFLRQEIKNNEACIKSNETRIVKSAEYMADIVNRLDAAEDYMRMIRSETENDKHADYWASVMNYNPYIEKEGEK